MVITVKAQNLQISNLKMKKETSCELWIMINLGKFTVICGNQDKCFISVLETL